MTKPFHPGKFEKYWRQEVERVLQKVDQPLELDDGLKPHVILMVGVNGTGKTTTIGKLAKQYSSEGKQVMLAAGDTFRAAAIEQLKICGQPGRHACYIGKAWQRCSRSLL